MSEMIFYAIGFTLGTIVGLFIMAIYAASTLKLMGLWILVKAFLRGANLNISVTCEPMNERSKNLLESMIKESVNRGEIRRKQQTKRGEDDYESGYKSE